MSKENVPSVLESGFHIFNKWLYLKQRNISLETYFQDNLFSTIAVYGYGALGQRLTDDLKQMDLNIRCIIDRNAEKFKQSDISIVSLSENLPKSDVIVVTPVQFFYEIESDLEKITDSYIVSLEDVVEYVYQKSSNIDMV